MVVPHPEVPLEGLLVGVEQPVVGGDAPAGVHVLQRLELGQEGLRQGLGVPDQGAHLVLPLVVEPLPVLIIVEGALLELLGAAGDLGRIGHRIAADVDAAVDHPLVDAEGGGQAVHPGVGCAQGAIGRLAGDHVEMRHRLGEVHGVVEPEAVVVRLVELHVVGEGGLGLLGPRKHLHRARQREARGLDRLVHGLPPWLRMRPAGPLRVLS